MHLRLINNVRLPGGGLASLFLEQGRIVALGPALEAGSPLLADPGAWDARGLLALPAGIDWHVHFREPGAPQKETLLSGARAAVKGGIATCGDMPNTQPPTITLQRLEEKLALAQGAPAHLYFHFGATADNLDQVRMAARHPLVKALKIFMGPSTGQGGLAPDATETHFRQAAELGLPVIVHAEDAALIQGWSGAFPHTAYHHTDLRGLEAELSAVRQALALARRYPVRLAIAHSTSARVLALCRESGLGERVFCEVTPHHLALAQEDIQPPDDNRYKVNPPLRPRAEQQALLACLAEGIDALGSDHAPHTLQEKAAPYDAAPSGIPGVETLLPWALTWWAQGRLDLGRLIALTSGNVACFYGLNKGRLAPGYDADIVLVDPRRSWSVGEGEDRVASRCGYSLFQGWPMEGSIEATVVGGRLVYTRQQGWLDGLPVPPPGSPPHAVGAPPAPSGEHAVHSPSPGASRDACCD